MSKNQNGLTFTKMLFKGSFIFNPVLTQAIGICAIVAIAVNLKISLTLSFALTVVLIINECLASLILKRLSRWIRVIVYMVLSTLLLTPVSIYLDKNFSQLYASMGVYFSLLSVNSLIVIRCEKYGVKNNLKYSFFDAVCAAIGFSAAAVIIASIREMIAYGTIYGKQMTSLPTYSAFAMPFGGLIIIGFLAAFHKWLIRKKFRGQPTNTFNLRQSMDDPVFKDEGIHVTDGIFSLFNDPEISEAISAAEAEEVTQASRLFENLTASETKEEQENTFSRDEENEQKADAPEKEAEEEKYTCENKADETETQIHEEAIADESCKGEVVLVPIEEDDTDDAEKEGDEV